MTEKLTKEEKKVIEKWVERLQSQNKREREGVGLRVALMGEKAAEHEETIPALMKALEDEDEGVREEVAVALGRMGKKVIPVLIKAIKDSEKEKIRAGATWALGGMREKAAENKKVIPTLIDALKKDEAWEVRARAAWALGWMKEEVAKNKDLIAVLIEAVKEEDERVSARAAFALGRMGEKAAEHEEAISALMKAITKETEEVCYYAAFALGEIGERAIPPLIEAVKDEKKSVRYWAVFALGEMREKATESQETLPTLIQALKKDEAWEVREGAARALGKIGKKAAENKKVIPALIEALSEEVWEVREGAAWALSWMGEKGEAAIEPLTKALKKEKEKEAKFAMAFSLAWLERKNESEGIIVLQEMEERGELEDWQESRFKGLCQELEIDESLEKTTEKVQGVRESIEQEESKTETLAKVGALEKELQILKQSFEKGKEERIRETRDLEQKIDLATRDVSSIQKEIKAIPHMQVAYKGKQLERQITTLTTDLQQLRTEFNEEIKKRIAIRNRWIGIGIAVNIFWIIVSVCLGLLFDYLDIFN